MGRTGTRYELPLAANEAPLTDEASQYCKIVPWKIIPYVVSGIMGRGFFDADILDEVLITSATEEMRLFPARSA